MKAELLPLYKNPHCPRVEKKEKVRASIHEISKMLQENRSHFGEFDDISDMWLGNLYCLSPTIVPWVKVGSLSLTEVTLSPATKEGQTTSCRPTYSRFPAIMRERLPRRPLTDILENVSLFWSLSFLPTKGPVKFTWNRPQDSFPLFCPQFEFTLEIQMQVRRSHFIGGQWPATQQKHLRFCLYSIVKHTLINTVTPRLPTPPQSLAWPRYSRIHLGIIPWSWTLKVPEHWLSRDCVVSLWWLLSWTSESFRVVGPQSLWAKVAFFSCPVTTGFHISWNWICGRSPWN